MKIIKLPNLQRLLYVIVYFSLMIVPVILLSKYCSIITGIAYLCGFVNSKFLHEW